MHIKQAFILAAWYGTRLRPLTLDTPKPLIPVGWKPLLEYHLSLLEKHWIEEIFINSFYLSEQIENYIQAQTHKVKIILSREEWEILGTAWGVMKQIDKLDDYFLVVYGDNLTDINYSLFFQSIIDKDRDAAIVLYHEENITQKGMAIVDETWYISWFIEKPKPEQVVSDLANGGIYIIKKDIFKKYVPATGFSDFWFDFFPKLIADGWKALGYITDSTLLDIGSFENLEKANNLFKSKTISLY